MRAISPPAPATASGVTITIDMCHLQVVYAVELAQSAAGSDERMLVLGDCAGNRQFRDNRPTTVPGAGAATVPLIVRRIP
ncbi:hypothetical protein MBOU_55510 [Mycobacterium bourgelatii]|uniref:Uncharacterized protein n=1 Tax=Mycobacterium bourgelatii TaxID=1273442 RepID=A0A7I9YXQ1_MYCBU|nr:hypothetical protein MBOU_55510 [Mycobacterium bourgelatii]